MTEELKKAKTLDVQIIATISLIFALILSVILAYNEKMIIENKETLFSNEEAKKISQFQTTLVFIIAIVFLTINYNNYEDTKSTCNSNNIMVDEQLRLTASVFAIMAALIGIYLAFSNSEN
ncbi:MAG: hypothetical protein RSA10_03595 [Bacilli bacterium]